MKEDTRRKLNVDSTRIWNMANSWPEDIPSGFRYSYLTEYFNDNRIMESLLGITRLSFNFQSMSIVEKNSYLKRFTSIKLKNRGHGPLEDVFYSPFDKGYVVLAHYQNSNIVRYTRKINRLFVPKFYHDRRNSNFLKNRRYVGQRIELTKKVFQK